MLHQAAFRSFQHRLRERTGVVKSGSRVLSVAMEDGQTFAATIFADCTYEGDLMAQAGVAYTVGREPATQYGESLGGVRERTPLHQFLVRVSPYDANGKLLPEVDPGPRAPSGSGDKKIQAYNFRLILLDDPTNRIAWAKPPDYDPHRYALLARLVEAMTGKLGRAPVLNDVTFIAPIPNRKADINNNEAFSTDYIGKSWSYPDGDYATRQRICEDHARYTRGFFYFLANDLRIPSSLREDEKFECRRP